MSERLDAVWAAVLEENPRHRGFLEGALAGLTPEESTTLAGYVDYLLAGDHSVESIAASYNTIVLDTLREQIWFMRNKRYRHQTFADVAGDVYFNPEYMRRYMVGLALSSFVWPNHAAMRRHYLDSLPAGRGGTYLEIGPGHGFYFLSAIRRGGYDRYVGVDISETSCALTRSVVDHFEPGAPAEVVCRDFLDETLDGAPFSAIVMGEVLEHVEAPQAFLERLAELSGPDTWLHVTTCINAPAIDHIYLYSDAAEVEAQIEAAGLVVRDRKLMPYVGKTLEQCAKQKLAVNVAYELGKA